MKTYPLSFSVVRVIPLLLALLPVKTLSEPHQYTYAWPYIDSDTMKPRGGSSTGIPIKLAPEQTESWSLLQESNLNETEKDRRAILAMAGAYRASFDFIETAEFVVPSSIKRPYQSWGTEYVYVVKDEPNFISLQHILVMKFQHQDGTPSDAMVVKHWRQDWSFEDRSMHTYVGQNSWTLKTKSKKDVINTWTQAVFQVDDSPRYESIGKWEHFANHSSWKSNTTWRPLPRREFSVRNDYDVLVGTNRHTITPSGWIHEEDNLKVKLDSNGDIEEVLAREAGFNRYERIVDFDFSAGDDYWLRTQPFWEDVGDAWREVYNKNSTFSLAEKLDDQSLIGAMFGYADALKDTYDEAAGKAFIRSTLQKYLAKGNL